MNEERPIVFTISEINHGVSMLTKDPRGSDENSEVDYGIIFEVMRDITETLNNKGYAVLFEVD